MEGSSLHDGRHEPELRIAMGMGIRWMHWPRLQEEHPGCWTFAANDKRQPEAVRKAIVEAIAFAGALMLPEPALRRALDTYKRERQHVCTTFRVDAATLEARLKRLRITAAWHEAP